jgi:hypothetical protein
MKTAVTFGTTADNIDIMADILKTALGLSLEPRHSSYLGEHYRLRADRIRGTLTHNIIDPDEPVENDRYREPDHKDCLVIFEVLIEDESEEFETTITKAGMRILEREIVTS